MDTAADIMLSYTVTVFQNTPLRQAARLPLNGSFNGLSAVEGGYNVGIVGMENRLRRLVNEV